MMIFRAYSERESEGASGLSASRLITVSPSPPPRPYLPSRPPHPLLAAFLPSSKQHGIEHRSRTLVFLRVGRLCLRISQKSAVANYLGQLTYGFRRSPVTLMPKCYLPTFDLAWGKKSASDSSSRPAELSILGANLRLPRNNAENLQGKNFLRDFESWVLSLPIPGKPYFPVFRERGSHR